MRATLDWSYGLLDAAAQILFAQLAVFVGGCTLPAAEAVCAAAGELPLTVLDGIVTLSDQSLLQLDLGPDGTSRCTMLETIRAYARERLEASGAAATRRAHAAYYLALAEDAEPKLHGAEQVGWLARLEAEHASQIGRGAELPEGPRRGVQLQLRRVLIACRPAGQPDEQPDTRGFVRRVELLPGRPRLAEGDEGAACIARAQEHGATVTGATSELASACSAPRRSQGSPPPLCGAAPDSGWLRRRAPMHTTPSSVLLADDGTMKRRCD